MGVQVTKYTILESQKFRVKVGMKYKQYQTDEISLRQSQTRVSKLLKSGDDFKNSDNLNFWQYFKIWDRVDIEEVRI